MSEQHRLDLQDLNPVKASQIKNKIDLGYSLKLKIFKIFSFRFPPYHIKQQQKSVVTFRVSPQKDESRQSILMSPMKIKSVNHPFLNDGKNTHNTTEINQSDNVFEDMLLLKNDRLQQLTLNNQQFEQAKYVRERNELLGFYENSSTNFPNALDNNSIEIKQLENQFDFLLQFSKNELYEKMLNAIQTYHNGNSAKALQELKQVDEELMEIMEKLTEQSTQYKQNIIIHLQTQCYIAQIYRCLGDPALAINMLESILKKFSFSEPELLGQVYMEIGQNYFQKFSFNRALDYFNKALLLYEKLDWSFAIPNALIGIAQIYAIYKWLDSAKKIGYCALEISQHLQPRDLKQMAEIYHTLGFIFYLAKDYNFSLEYLETSNEIIEKNLEGTHFAMIKNFNIMGIMSHLQGKIEQAILYYEKAAGIYNNQDQIAYAQVCNNLALAYNDFGDIQSCELYFDRALQIYCQYYEGDHHLKRRTERSKFEIKSTTLQ